MTAIDGISLVVPPADTAELWTSCTTTGEELFRTRGDILRADALGLPVGRLLEDEARLAIAHDILVREYNRRTAR